MWIDEEAPSRGRAGTAHRIPRFPLLWPMLSRRCLFFSRLGCLKKDWIVATLRPSVSSFKALLGAWLLDQAELDCRPATSMSKNKHFVGKNWHCCVVAAADRRVQRSTVQKYWSPWFYQMLRAVLCCPFKISFICTLTDLPKAQTSMIYQMLFCLAQVPPWYTVFLTLFFLDSSHFVWNSFDFN